MATTRGGRLRTLLLGVDAACERVLDPLVEAGAVPTLASLFDRGATGRLESQVPPWTPSAWPSLYTGVNPGRHGVFGFLTYDGYDWDVVNATDVREPALWELLDHHGLRSVVVNVPVTHPPAPVGGAVVPGYTAPPNPDCHPSGLLAELRSAVGPYRVYDEREGDVDTYRDLVAMRGRAFRHLVDQFDPHFGFLQFQQTDTVFHECPEEWETVEAVYRAVDDEVAAVLDQCDPDVVVVASDHGIGEYGGWEFRVNDYLHEHGVVATSRGPSEMPSWSRALQQMGDTPEDGTGGQLERVVSLAASLGVTSQRIGAALDRVGLRDVVLEYAPSTLVQAGTEGVDFPASRAYMRSRIELGVRINLAGREPEGQVDPEAYDQVRAEVVELLRDATTPDGSPVFETVAPREAVFEGPHVEAAPDVVVVPDQYDHFLSAQIAGDPFDAEPREPWNHKRHGVVAVAGEGVDEAASVGGAHLLDVAPTVLATLGVPAGAHMEGEVLSPVEPVGVTDYPAYDDDRSRATASSAVESHLADMGYLE